MKLKLANTGYTIIEVMMFLLVSSALLTSALLAISGREESIRFSQSNENFEFRIKDVLNDTATGFYPNAGDIACVDTPTSLTISSGTNVAGTNTDCIFLGKAIEFASGSEYNLYTMVGARDATSLTDAKTALLGVVPNQGIIENETISANIEIKKIVSLTDDSRTISGIALVSNFSKTSALGNKVSGNAARVTMYEVESPFISNAGKDTMNVASNGILVCLQQAGGGRESSLKIGSDGQGLTTDLQVDQNRDVRCSP